MKIETIRPNIKKIRTEWYSEFRCHCSTVFVASNTSVRTGRRYSCGCMITRTVKRIKIGDIFDMLMVVAQIGSDKFGTISYRTICKCGNFYNISSSKLRNNKNNNCGCSRGIHLTKTRTKNLLNKVFGRLKVIAKIELHLQNKLKIKWMCLCRCGNIKYSESRDLKTIKSCGCEKSEIISRIMITHGKSHTREYARIYKIRRRDSEKIETDWKSKYHLFIKSEFKKCAICDSTNNLQIDHIRPISLGFPLTLFNVSILCKSCNCSKSNKDIIELDSYRRNKIMYQSIDIVEKYIERYGEI